MLTPQETITIDGVTFTALSTRDVQFRG